MKKTIIAFALLCTIGLTVHAYAWPDGKREGLIMGLTAGIGDVEIEWSGGNSSSGTGKMAGCYLGIGLSEQFLLNFRYRYINASINSITYHTFNWSGDIMYFPMPGNGFFINGGFGRALVDPDAYRAESKSGTVWHVGLGYEITKWVFLGLDYAKSDLEDNIGGNTIMFSISVIGY